jgi:hypothetical protein
MALDKQLKLIQLLIGRTKDGSVEWRPTPDQKTFQVVFKDTSLLLRQTPSSMTPDEYDYEGRIVNSDGIVVERFSDADFYAELGGPIGYKLMHELFDLARRKALGTDKVIDSIIDELNDIPF